MSFLSFIEYIFSIRTRLGPWGVIGVIFFFLVLLGAALLGIVFFIYKKFDLTFPFLLKFFVWLTDEEEKEVKTVDVKEKE